MRSHKGTKSSRVTLYYDKIVQSNNNAESDKISIGISKGEIERYQIH